MKVVLIGCSGMGRVHAQMLGRAGFTLAACVDLDKKAAAALAKAHGGRAMTDAAAAIALPGVGVVCIATPTHTHLPLIEMAAKAGKHIFCEKPFCRTAAQCRKAIAAAKKAGVKLFVGHVVRYFHEFEALKAQVESGAIGEPGFVRLYRGGLFPGGPKSWFADYAKSGGVTFDCMIHDLDWIRHVFGEPERIFCQALMRSKPVPMDYSQATLRMRSGVIASVVGTWAHPSGFQVKAEICGSGGMVQYDSADAPMRALKRETGSGSSMVVPESPVAVSPYQREWEDFRAWLADGAAPRVTPEDALRAVEMAEAALASAKSGQPVAL